MQVFCTYIHTYIYADCLISLLNLYENITYSWKKNCKLLSESKLDLLN
jgi:hypothetical protein